MIVFVLTRVLFLIIPIHAMCQADPVNCPNLIEHPASKCDVAICGDDQMCVEYHRLANELQYNLDSIISNNFRIRNVTNRSIDRSNKTITYGNESDYIFENSCRVVENPSIRSINSTSYSPWEYIVNIDENRTPRAILETKCLCEFCLNRERTGLNRRIVTKPFLVTRYFHLKGNGTTVFNAEFSYGCQCIVTSSVLT